MEVYRSEQFARWAAQVVSRAKAGDQAAIRVAKHALDELNYLKELTKAPTADTATLKKVMQSKENTIWRLSHPFDPVVAVRIICWFDNQSETAVVVLFGSNKAQMGDVFYNSAGARADQEISDWKRRNESRP